MDFFWATTPPITELFQHFGNANAETGIAKSGQPPFIRSTLERPSEGPGRPSGSFCFACTYTHDSVWLQFAYLSMFFIPTTLPTIINKMFWTYRRLLLAEGCATERPCPVGIDDGRPTGSRRCAHSGGRDGNDEMEDCARGNGWRGDRSASVPIIPLPPRRVGHARLRSPTDLESCMKNRPHCA